jgi:hypothetical protein
MEKGEEEVHLNENDEGNTEGEVTFVFHIVDLTKNIQMKNISPFVWPHFHGMVIEDPDAFIFEFDILCRSYEYWNVAHKLKLFPATLKDSVSCWIMGLGGNTIRTWDEMRTDFLRKFQECCKDRDLKE